MTHRNLNTVLVLALIFFANIALAQPVEELGPVTARPQTYTPAKVKKKTTASISLPFFDDFSYDQHYPDTALWEDAHVYINQTYGQAPPTLGVATFDGLNKDGQAYDLTDINTDSADVLTSRAINLSSTIDSTYLSFFWQAGGNGERPEPIDSFNLKFYSPQTQTWNRVWGVFGVDSTAFQQVMIPITKPQHLRDGFKFRFTAYGASAGAFDTWNLDYVRLSDQRTKIDTAFTEPAFTRPHASLLKTFEAVPWFHYTTLAPIENKSTLLHYYQRNIAPGGALNLNLCIYQISAQGNVLASNNTGDATKDNSHNPNVETVFDCAITPFNLPTPPTGEFEINALATYSGFSQATKGPNDSIVRNQTFKNYYALDDGSAERAYQVRDNRGGFVITKYDIAQADSLLGLYLYFMPSQYDVEQNEFSIVIYENNNDLPGNLIYETDSLYTPRYTSTNFMLPYQLDKSVWVTGPVFIGVRQKSNIRMPIGFDVNTTKRAKMYFGTISNLYESFQEGNLMMRPYLRYQPLDISVPELKPETLEINVYPNPANDYIRIETTERTKNLAYTITNLSGQVIQSGQVEDELRFSQRMISGVYLLRIEDPSGKKAPVVKKILVKR